MEKQEMVLLVLHYHSHFQIADTMNIPSYLPPFRGCGAA
jgi:hypothetical protein